MIKIFILPLMMFTMMFLKQDISKSKRILCIYARDENNPAYREQLHLIATDKQGLTERDIIIEKFTLNYRTIPDFKKRSVIGDFNVILIGKDGGEKYRSAKVLTLRKLYAIVDAMPMRREEMRLKKYNQYTAIEDSSE